ncbi:MAG: DUF3185 domain-containing protein [bacterium]|jgi:hypothetical protein|nr:DUF3185 domain-containing protein [bacterium]
MKAIGIALVIAGFVALVYGGFSYSRHREVLDLGPLKTSATEHKDFPVPAAAGAAVLLVGFALVVGGNRRPRRQ